MENEKEFEAKSGNQTNQEDVNLQNSTIQMNQNMNNENNDATHISQIKIENYINNTSKAENENTTENISQFKNEKNAVNSNTLMIKSESTHDNTSHIESKGNEISTQKFLHAITNRLNDVAEMLEDPSNEGDDFYSTVWRIYTFFNHEHSFLTILNMIHQSAGDVKLAIRRLARQKERNESSVFSYKDVIASNAAIEKYFEY